MGIPLSESFIGRTQSAAVEKVETCELNQMVDIILVEVLVQGESRLLNPKSGHGDGQSGQQVSGFGRPSVRKRDQKGRYHETPSQAYQKHREIPER
jgi:hypothetical protein